MSRFKAHPKQKSYYPGICSRAELLRKGFKGLKKPVVNIKAKSLNAKMLQRFSGKLGK
jgi:hypothetical protein